MVHDKRIGSSSGVTANAAASADTGIGKRTLIQDLPPPQAAPVQRKFDDTLAPAPNPGTDNFSGGKLPEADVALLTSAAAKITTAIDAHADKQVLLFIGVGTGNPMAAWGNPTVGGVGAITDQQQQAPGVLADAQKRGYFVIAANFNVGGGEITEQADENILNLHVPGRFPLEAPSDGPAKEALAALHAAAKKAERFAILNSVTHTDYGPILELAKAKSKGQSSYMKSYMQTGQTSAYSPFNAKKGFTNAGAKHDTMEDVFFADHAEAQETD
jgi:hypothetical protein